MVRQKQYDNRGEWLGGGWVGNSALSWPLWLPVSMPELLPFAWLSGFRACQVCLFSICTSLCCCIWYLARKWYYLRCWGQAFVGRPKLHALTQLYHTETLAVLDGNPILSKEAVLPYLKFLGAGFQVPKLLSQVPWEPVVAGKVWMDMADKGGLRIPDSLTIMQYKLSANSSQIIAKERLLW